MTTDTVFDVAGLTKIMAVWASVGMLWENGELALEDPLTALLPDLDGYPLGRVTIHQLLTHTAGVPLRANLTALYGTDPAAIRRGVLHEQLPGHRAKPSSTPPSPTPRSSCGTCSTRPPRRRGPASDPLG